MKNKSPIRSSSTITDTPVTTEETGNAGGGESKLENPLVFNIS